MAYLKTTANSPIDLLQKLNAWLVSIGWVSDCSKTDGTGWWTTLHKNGNYVHLRATMGDSSTPGLFPNKIGNATWGIELTMGNGYNAAPSQWCDQPGVPTVVNETTPLGVGCPMPSGAIIAAHFFSTDAGNEHIVVVVEKTPNVFGNLCWGPSIEKCGSFVGGQYFSGSIDGRYYSDSYSTGGSGFLDNAMPPGSYRVQPMIFVRCDVDAAFTGKWVGLGSTYTGYEGYTGRRGGTSCRWTGDASLCPVYTNIENRFTTTLTGQSVLVPIRLFVERQIGGFSLIGNLPNIYQSSACWQGFANGGTYQWGTDSYIVFPGFGTNDSRGFAVKLVS